MTAASGTSPLLTPLEHCQKCQNSTPWYNTCSVKYRRCDQATTVLTLCVSRLPTMKFSHFWQLFDFSLTPNWPHADFFCITLLTGLCVIPKKIIKLETREVPAQILFFSDLGIFRIRVLTLYHALNSLCSKCSFFLVDI